MRDFNHLHIHTNLGSMLDSLVDIDALFDKAKEMGQKAVCISDHGTCAGHFDAFKAYKRTGVKFLPACEFYFVNSFDVLEEGKKKTERRKHLLLIAQTQTGYKNLLQINHLGFQNQVVSMGRVFPRINWDIIKEYSKDIICLSACINGPIGALLVNGLYDEAEEVAVRLQGIFNEKFYIEIQPHLLKDGDVDQDVINKQLINIAGKNGIPLVVSNDVHYLTKADEKYHDILLAINAKKAVDDPDRHRYGIQEFYLKGGDEIFAFVANKYGLEIAVEVLENTIKIADMCDNPDYMETTANHLPIFPVKDEPDYQEFLAWKEKVKLPNIGEDLAFMRFRCVKGFREKFSDLPEEKIKERMDRLKMELKVIEGNKFSSYMLVVSDFINWARKNDILVGCGRGSAGGSLIAYLLDIHRVDPLEYNLLFERFQNAEKKSLPDIDTDFTSAGRDKVQEYVINKYGKDCCAHVSNINTFTPKNVIPNLVKSMRNVIPNLVKEGENHVRVSEAIKDAIPDADEDGNPVKTLTMALALSKPLRDFAEKSPELMECAQALIGLPKEYATHAAALVISDKPIVEFAPIRIDKDGKTAIQYEKERCEALGLVKMDFLAISTLDIIAETFNNIRRLNMIGPKTMEEIPLTDVATYKMIQQGQTRCVFQLGKTASVASLCKQIQPNNIYDIAVINALCRPSCRNERQVYIDRRFGIKPIQYLHPSLETTLKDTYGLCIFEEQLMGVAKDVAGWNLNKADGLRKLTKLKGKGKDLALKLEIDFIEGAMKKHTMPYELAERIWKEVVLKFSGYGFNLSHAVLYSINSYYTAYLKCHFPTAYLTANLKIKADRGGVNKDEEITMAKTECRRLKIKIIPPDVNRSSGSYEVLDKETIVMGFSAVKGLGEKAIEEIVVKQPYQSFVDFLHKTEARVINKSKMEALAKAGSFDSFKLSRKETCEQGKTIRERLASFIKKQNKDGYYDFSLDDFPLGFNNIEWSKAELLKNEYEVLGELVSGSLDDLYPNFFTNYNMTALSNIKRLPDRHEITVEVLAKSIIREFKIKKEGRNKGKTMVKYHIEDIYGAQSELTVWPSEYDKVKKLVGDGGKPIRAKCQVSDFNGSKTLMLMELQQVYKTNLTTK